MQSSKQGMWKGYHLSIKGIQKGYLFREKWYIKGKGLDLGAKPPRKNICWVPPGRQCILTAAVWMKQNQNAIAAINHQRAIRIKLHDHSWLFYQSLKILAFVESYFRSWGSRFSGRCRCGEVLGSFNIDDGNGSENVTFKMNFVAFIPICWK